MLHVVRRMSPSNCDSGGATVSHSLGEKRERRKVGKRYVGSRESGISDCPEVDLFSKARA